MIKNKNRWEKSRLEKVDAQSDTVNLLNFYISDSFYCPNFEKSLKHSS